MDFQITARDSASSARCGLLSSAAGHIETPAFMPCASHAVVRACSPYDIAAVGIKVMMCNAFHLLIRPGSEVIQQAGGLRKFMNWPGLIATDSGGFQVFSLADRSDITEEGVSIRSPLDGSPVQVTPELSIQVQNELGADIIMAFDDCTPYPCGYEEAARSMERTLRWAERSKAAHNNSAQALFGIVQGSVYPELRQESARATAVIGFPGYAIGGVSVGETEEEMFADLEAALPELPEAAPKHLLGVGIPMQMIEAVTHGIDLFDCVIPTRNARHGLLYTWEGILRINNAQYRDDFRPLSEQCDCPACSRYSRAYLHHLFRIEEAAAWRLLTLHNLRFFAQLRDHIRQALPAGELAELGARVAANTGEQTGEEGGKTT